MKLRTALVAVAAVTTLIAGASDASARSPCAKRGSQTVLASAHARIVRVHSPEDLWWVYYGCLYRRGRFIELGEYDGSSDSELDGLRLAGRFVAIGTTIVASSGTHYLVFRFDLRRGRERRWSTGELTEEQAAAAYFGVFGVGPVVDLELKRNGSLAWIARDVYSAEPDGYEVRKVDRSGEALLEDSPDVEPESLAASGGRLYWTTGREPRSAPFD